MQGARVLLAVAVMALPQVGSAVAGDNEAVPVYTRDDLDRMFGPAPKQSSDPVDKSGPKDWAWVEQFLDRQYAHIEEDRRYDLNRGLLDTARRPVASDPWSYTSAAIWSPGYYGGYGYAGWGGWHATSSVYWPVHDGGPHPDHHDRGGFHVHAGSGGRAAFSGRGSFGGHGGRR